jgi:plasmid stabilization system protein ParE
MNVVKYHPEARLEFRSSALWYGDRNEQLSVDFTNEVERIAEIIRVEPKRYPMLDRRHRYKVLDRFPYYIVYLVRPGLTYIIAVAHAKLPPNYWRHRKMV